MVDEATKFWEDFEKETGEKVEARSIGEYYEADYSSVGVWGLLVLTDKSFRFKHMPNDNWILSIFRRVNKPSTPKAPVEFTISRADIVSVSSPARGIWARLFGPPFPPVFVTARSENALAERRYSFSLDPGSGLLAALQHVVTPH